MCESLVKYCHMSIFQKEKKEENIKNSFLGFKWANMDPIFFVIGQQVFKTYGVTLKIGLQFMRIKKLNPWILRK